MSLEHVCLAAGLLSNTSEVISGCQISIDARVHPHGFLFGWLIVGYFALSAGRVGLANCWLAHAEEFGGQNASGLKEVKENGAINRHRPGLMGTLSNCVSAMRLVDTTAQTQKLIVLASHHE